MFKKLIYAGIFQSNCRNIRNRIPINFIVILIGIFGLFQIDSANAAQFNAGVAKVNITNTEPASIVNNSLYVKELVLDNGTTRAVIITLEAVAIRGIGSISSDYLSQVRSQIKEELNNEAAGEKRLILKSRS